MFRLSKNGMLLRSWKSNEGERILIVLTETLARQVIWEIHKDYLNHLSIRATIRIFQSKFYTFRARYNIQKILSTCPPCVSTNPQKRTSTDPYGTRIEFYPLETISVDNFHYPKSTKGNKQLTIVVDNFSRVAHFEPNKNGNSLEIAQAVENFIYRFGIPTYMSSDHFSGNLAPPMRKLTEKYGISLKMGGISDSRQNGLVESLGKHVLYSLLKREYEKPSMKDWDKNIPELNFQYNTIPRLCLSEGHMLSPYDIIFRHSHQTPLSNIARLKKEVLTQKPEETTNRIYDEVRESRRLYLAKISKKYQPFLNVSEHKLGDIVFFRRTSFGKNINKKFQTKFTTPGEITEKIAGNLFLVTNLKTNTSSLCSSRNLIKTNLQRQEALLLSDQIEKRLLPMW